PAKNSNLPVEDLYLSETYKQDHNYGRRSGIAQKNDGENGEKFPIIGGLASYIGDEVSKVPASCHPRDANSGHFSRSQNYGAHYRKISEIDPRTSCRIYSASVSSCRTNQMRRQFLPVDKYFPDRLPSHLFIITGLLVESDVLFRSRHFVTSGGTFGISAPSNRRVLRPAYPPTSAVSTCRPGMRQIIPTSKSISSTMPAYATAVNATIADSEAHGTDMSTGLAPFLVPSRRPRPVVRNRARPSREPDKGAELLVQKPIANDPQIDNTVHTEVQSDIIIAPRQRLPKNIARNSEAIKQQYIMAEPLEPCHVPRPQHTTVQRAVPNADCTVNMVADEKLSPKSLQNSSAAVHHKEEHETSLQSLSVDSHEPIHDNNEDRMHDPQHIAQAYAVFPHRSPQDIAKHEEHDRKSRKESFVANSRQLLTRQLDELQMRQEISLHRQQPISPGHVAGIRSRISSSLNQEHGFDSQQRAVLQLTSVETEVPVLTSKDRTASDNIPVTSDGAVALKKIDHKAHSVEDMSSREEPPVFNETCNEAFEQRVSVATRSSISGAEEETSVNGNGDEKETEDEGDRTTEVTADIDSPSNSNSDDDWEGEYTTRCYCGLNHNDEFMIQCDVCNVWQHGKCMDIDRRRVPDTYQCEECNPRQLKLSKTQAREMQLKVLARQRREKDKKRRQKAKGPFKKKIREKSEETKKRQVRGNSSKNFVECFKYEYSRSVMAFSRKHEDTGDPAILEALQNDDGVSVMYVTQVSKGLVSTRLYHGDEPVIYICGRVSLLRECRGREEPGSIIPFVILYSDLLVGENREPTPICIDARRFGSKARFARASCRPNIKLQHFFLKGKLHIIGIAAGNIERGEEITLPFDADYFMSKTKLVCACSADDEDDSSVDCLVRNFNRSYEQKQNRVSATVAAAVTLRTVSNPVVNVDTTSKDHVKKKCMGLDKNNTSESQYSPITSSSKMIASDYSDEVNAVGMIETTIAVTPTTEDENATNKDVLSDSSVEMQSHIRTFTRDSSRRARSKLSKTFPSTLSHKKKRGVKLRYSEAASDKNVETRQDACTNECGNSVIPPKAETFVVSLRQEWHEEKRQVAWSKESEGQSVEENKVMTEELRTHTEAEILIENVQKSDKVGAGSVFTKHVGRPRKKRRASVDAKVVGAVDWTGNGTGNEHLVPSGSLKKTHHKRNSPVDKVESVNYTLPEDRNKAMAKERKVLQELALFERMHQRETKRQQHVVSMRRSGSTESACCPTSTNGPSLDSKVVAKVADGTSDRKNTRGRPRSHTIHQSYYMTEMETSCRIGRKKPKNGKGRRRKASSESSSVVGMKRSRTMSEVAKLRGKSEADQGLNNDLIKKTVSFSSRAKSFTTELKSESKMDGNVGGKVQSQELEIPNGNTTLKCKGSLLCAKREIQKTGSIQESITTIYPASEEHIKDEVEPLSKRKRESHGIDNESESDMLKKASHSSRFSRTASSFATACKPLDFSVHFQTLEGVQLPSTSLHSECSKNQMKIAEAPKKKMSLDEYKRRKSSKTTVDSEKTSTDSVEKKVEDAEHKQMPSSRSFIPLMSAGGSVGKRTSLRLGALPDPVQLRATPTLSIDDLKRRIYRRTTPSTAVTSNIDGTSLSSYFMVQKNASHSSPGQCSEEGPTSFVSSSSSSSWRREIPSTVPSNKDKRLPLEERLRLVLGCGEGYTDRYSSSVSPPAVPPPPPPPPPLPIKNPEIPKMKCDLSGDVRSAISLPPPPPVTTSSGSQLDKRSYEAHALGPRRG
uniref:SET domain-containing protein n=1 Tax=Elaeophora elaphi TaxID=1147741 RepID=A0A0R3S4H8_9BILA